MALMIAVSCISDVEFGEVTGEGKFVIEGTIETNGPARVLITRTLPMTGTVYTADLYDLIVTEARVMLSDGQVEEQLSLVMDSLDDRMPIFRSYRIFGKQGRVYTLKVTLEDMTYTAVDTMLAPCVTKGYDFRLNADSDSLGLIYLRFQDPPEAGNYYMLWSKREGHETQFKRTGMLLNDFYFNGQDIEVEIRRTSYSYLVPVSQYFEKGDRMILKMTSLTPTYYKYISTAKYETYSAGNPLMTHIPVFSNFDGEVLGAWGCLAARIDTLDLE
jgi:hypothetical protein